ncbi:hypothetical protein [Bdellovibrio sp. NC01]|uniref:hypothetical protein n=1 Tax=Bdellovibrio sp. NC01 TaxID=2220073 RepID=UPI0011581057|nr:hypothetical protein [Bdellovibrio sp. NC01]QDK38200.1 hypothetical protein DOE51_11700 [Bdellovibrio sp. NC01]
METLNKKTLSFSTKLFGRAVATLALIFTMAACGNKGGDSNNSNYLWGANCATCVTSLGNGTAIDVFNASNATRIANLVNMQLIVNGSTFVPGASSSYNLYTGPVAVSGTFTLSQMAADPATGQCAIPAGSYTVQTASIGQMSLGSIELPDLITTNGVQIRMSLRGGVLYKDAMTQRTRLFGSLYITSVNGIPCSNAFSDTLN